MQRSTFFAAALLVAAAVSPPPAGAQTDEHRLPTASYAMSRIDRETQMLAAMRNQISEGEISMIAVSGLGPSERRMLTPRRRSALRAAMDKATVASNDRANGESEDQNSLSEYVQRHHVDPNNVLAVAIQNQPDPQNPHVTLFYRR